MIILYITTISYYNQNHSRIGFWIQTYLGSVNSGKAHSQVFKAILLRLNELKEVKAMLGDQICFQETSRIKGDVNHIKGIADLSVRLSFYPLV